MDVCTLVIATVVTLQACWTDNVCHQSADGTKQFCTGVQQKACPQAMPWYECKREDGSTYTLPWTADQIAR